MAEKRKEVRYIAEKFANAILADASSYIISTDGLQALNAFLDELLFILIDNAKGLETNRIKAAVYQTFPTPLGKNAIVEAELEAKSYIDMGGKDTSNHMGNSGPSSSTSAIFNADSDESRVEQVFEQFRAKCQYYSKLGERLGSPAGCPNNSVIVPTLIAIYVTAVLEHVAEYVLQAASTIADRQDHADKVTVREVYVALLEDRQIEHTFEIMILKSQLQRRFRNSLIMPGSNVRPEEPATVKRSGSWGKQLRLGNADKPKLDVQLPTDFEDDDIPIDPNRPQFADWDVPPDEESKLKKKNDFEMLFSSGETMKVSLTPNRLRTIEVHRKAGGVGGNVATRSSSRAASVLGGRTHGRRPSNGTPAANNNVAARKNSYAATLVDGQAPLPSSPSQQEPSVPSIPSNFGSSPPVSRRQEQLGTNVNNPPLSPMQQQQLRQQQQQQQSSEPIGYGVVSNKKQPQPPAELKMERASTSTMESQLTLSTAGTSNMTPISPVNAMSFNSQNGPNRLASPNVKTTAQATSDLVSLLGRTPSQASSFSQQPQAQQSSESLASSASITEAANGKKENPIKNFMGRLGRNSLHRLSTDNSSASSPTSIRSFNVSGGTTGQQGPGSGTGSASNSTNGSIYSGHSGQTSLATAAAASSPAHHAERQGSGMSSNDVVTQQQQQFYQQSPPQQQQPSSMQSGNRVLAQESHSNFALVSGFPIPQENGNANARAPVSSSKTASDYENGSDHSTSKMSVPAPVNTSGVPSSPKTAPPEQHTSSSPKSPEAGGYPIPSRGTSLSHDVTSPTATNYPSSYDAARQGTEPRPLSPRIQSPRSSSPMSSSPRSHSPLQASPTQYPYNRSNSTATADGGILSPSPLSNAVSANTSPSSSSLSLIAYGKVQHIQDKLSKTAQTPAHGFKPQEHLQNLPTRISLEGTIRANPFYQQDRNSSARSSSSLVGNTGYSTEISTPQYTKGSSPAPESPDHGSSSTPAATPNAHGGSNSSGSESGGDREEEEERRHVSRDGMVSPATSPEMGAQKDRLPSATTRTLTAAAAAATALTTKQQQLSTTPPNSGSRLQSKVSETESLRSLSSQRSRDMSANGDQKSTTHEQRHQEEDEEDVPYVAPVPRARVSSNRQSNRQSVRQSIFVDEAAQAMDALSRARHRQSMRLENGADLEDEDDDDDDEDYMNQNIQPPEKWHYSDLEDETSEAKDSEDSEEEREEDMEYEYEEPHALDGERRKKHESFMSAKSHLMHNGSTASLLDAYTDHHDENGDYDDETMGADVKDQHLRSLEVQEPTTTSDQNSTANQFDVLVPAVDSEGDEERNGEDEDESEDSEDLEDNDDEEGQDRRIYLQHLRAQKREARRLERLASGETEETLKKGRGKSGSRRARKVSSLDSTGAASTETTTTGDTKKKGLRKGHSKENLRAQQQQQQGRPQTPTTPVPTTQVIPLTPTDLVLIRQKLFAAGNFEASMRMLDTIFHAAMAKMVEGRERGVQTEPMSFQDNESEAAVPAAAAAAAALPSKESKKSVHTSCTSTSTTEDSDQPQKQLQWVAVDANEPKAVAAVADDDDEDRVVEWLLGGV